MEPRGVFIEEPSGSSLSWLPPEGWGFSGKVGSLLKEICHLHFSSGRNIVNENFGFIVA
jgi:hypothetical protein